MTLFHDTAHAMRIVCDLVEQGLPEGREAIVIAQRALTAAGYDAGPPDGIAGPRTRGALARAVADYMAHGEIRITRYDEPDGVDLRVRADGGPWDGERTYYPATDEAPRLVTWHWTAGSTTAAGLARGLRRSRLSSHFAIDSTGIYQMLPLDTRAWHARWVNRISIGVDICQPVRTERLAEALADGYQTEIVDNPTRPRRGDRQVLALDPRIAAKARWLAEHLSDATGIPMQAPRGDDGRVEHHRQVWSSERELGDWRGHVGHHHVEAPNRRSDIAPWWGSIFDGTTAGDA